MGDHKKAAKKAAAKLHAKDRKLGKHAAKARRHPVTRLIGDASEAADQPPLIALAILTIGAGLVLRQPLVARSGVRMLAAHGLATGIKSVLKRSVDRTRPRAAGKRGYKAEQGSSADPDLSSFPSGHTAGAVAVAKAAAHETPAVAPAAGAAVSAVAAAQLPTGKHYLSDVVVGAAIGWISAAVADAVIDRLLGKPQA